MARGEDKTLIGALAFPVMQVQSVFALDGVFDCVGIAALAASGALALGARSSNLGSALFVGLMAGLSGLGLRDLLLRSTLVAVADPLYVGIVAAAAGAVWAGGPRTGGGLFLWLDAIGLALVTASSTATAAAFGVPPLACLMLGALAGCFGGVARDMVLGREPVLLGGGIYASAAILGAAMCVALRLIGASPSVAAGFSAAVTLVLRTSAMPSLLKSNKQ